MSSIKKSLKKRKRGMLVLEVLSKEEKDSQLGALHKELNELYKYYNEVLEENKKIMNLDLCSTMSFNSLIGCLLEGSSLPLSQLVDEIVKRRDTSLTVAHVKSSVLLVGKRSFYGLLNVDADVLEDDSDSCLWCWEVIFVFLYPHCSYSDIFGVHVQ